MEGKEKRGWSKRDLKPLREEEWPSPFSDQK
jgi:hypothetical protein